MKTIKVRFCVGVDTKGLWASVGDVEWKDDEARRQVEAIMVEMTEDPIAYHWVTAELPIPEEIEIAGSVE